MVVHVRLQGGLGNQLFQYATARALSVDRSTSVMLDTTWYNGLQRNLIELAQGSISDAVKHRRAPQIDQFKIIASVAARPQIRWPRLAAKRSILASTFNALRIGPQICIEETFGFDPKLAEAPEGDLYLRGWRQSEKYFARIADILRRELQPRDDRVLDAARKAIARVRRGRPLVSLHVRRGDYLTGTTDLVITAPETIRSQMKEFDGADFLLFSDDLPWCRRAFSAAPNIQFAGRSSEVQEIMMMSLCDHHIIANSSFSWWGAWLDPKPGKIVIAPNDWFTADFSARNDTSDLLPQQWRRVG
jgi:hypothetical protein